MSLLFTLLFNMDDSDKTAGLKPHPKPHLWLLSEFRCTTSCKAIVMKTKAPEPVKTVMASKT